MTEGIKKKVIVTNGLMESICCGNGLLSGKQRERAQTESRTLYM
jgi:hypothetical protein